MTNVGVISGNETMKASEGSVEVSNSRSSVVFGAAFPSIQILDLEDLEIADKAGKTSEGLGITTAGTLGHEIEEANIYQSKESEQKAVAEGQWETVYETAHEGGIKVENRINGNKRIPQYGGMDVGRTQNIHNSDGTTDSFTEMTPLYKTNSGFKKAVYQTKNGNLQDSKPKTKEGRTPTGYENKKE